MKVLAIIDNKEIKKNIACLLHLRWPNTVMKYTNADGGIEAIQADTPHLIIIDLACGNSLVDEIREFTDAPLIILADKSNYMDGVKALEKGADELILKPIKAKDFLARIRALLRLTGKENSNGTNLSLLHSGQFRN